MITGGYDYRSWEIRVECRVYSPLSFRRVLLLQPCKALSLLALFLPFHSPSRVCEVHVAPATNNPCYCRRTRTYSANLTVAFNRGKINRAFQPSTRASWRKKKTLQTDDRFIVYRLSINRRDFFEKRNVTRDRWGQYMIAYINDASWFTLSVSVHVFDLGSCNDSSSDYRANARDYINSSIANVWIYIYFPFVDNSSAPSVSRRRKCQ